MAKSGKCTITRDSYSVQDNTSKVTVKGIITTSGDSWRGDERTGTYAIKQGSAVIKSGSFTHGAPKNSTTTLFSFTLTVDHKSDGTSDVISASYNYDDGWCTGSGTLALGTIPRQATITSAPNFDDESNPTIGYSNSAGNSASSLQACISLDGSSADIAYRDISKTGKSYTFQLTDVERNTLRNACKSAKSRTVYFYVKTVIGNATYYSKLQRMLTIVNATPMIEVAAEDVNPHTIELTGNKNIFVKYESNASVSMMATALKGATIKSYAIACGNKSISKSSGILNAVESPTITFSATDSRGYITSVSVIKEIIEYVPLSCVFTPSQPSAEGDMSFTVSGTCYSGSFGSKSNAITVQYRYKADDGSYGDWTTISNVTFADGKYTAKGSVTGLDYTKTYKFQARIVDSLDTKETSEYGISINPIFYWGKDRFNFGVNVMIGDKTGYKDGKTGIYADKQGFLHLQRNDGNPYLALGSNGDTDYGAQITYDKDASGLAFKLASMYKFDNWLSLPNEIGIYGRDASGANKSILHLSSANNTVVGWGGYANEDGNTNVYGNDVLVISKAGGSSSFRPYFRAGDSVTIYNFAPGFLTNGNTQVCFTIPFSRPIIGSPTITVTSSAGFILRQNNAYTHGSGSSTYVKPTSMVGTLRSNHAVTVIATFGSTTNSINNSPIGITAHVIVTFS